MKHNHILLILVLGKIQKRHLTNKCLQHNQLDFLICISFKRTFKKKQIFKVSDEIKLEVLSVISQFQAVSFQDIQRNATPYGYL